jgi:hypothetical protein
VRNAKHILIVVLLLALVASISACTSRSARAETDRIREAYNKAGKDDIGA